MFGVGDVPVSAQHGVAAAGGQLRHPLGQRGHEPFLLHLTVGAGLPGVHVEAAHSNPGNLDFQVTAVLLEFGCAKTYSDVIER